MEYGIRVLFFWIVVLPYQTDMPFPQSRILRRHVSVWLLCNKTYDPFYFMFSYHEGSSALKIFCCRLYDCFMKICFWAVQYSRTFVTGASRLVVIAVEPTVFCKPTLVFYILYTNTFVLVFWKFFGISIAHFPREVGVGVWSSRCREAGGANGSQSLHRTKE